MQNQNLLLIITKTRAELIKLICRSVLQNAYERLSSGTRNFLSSAGFVNNECIYTIQSEAYKVIQVADFRIDLIGQLIERYAEPMRLIGHPIIRYNPKHLTAWHFPSLIAVTATGNIGQIASIVCKRTSRRKEKNINTRYQCYKLF